MAMDQNHKKTYWTNGSIQSIRASASDQKVGCGARFLDFQATRMVAEQKPQAIKRET
jgi:hypothetical protein